MAKKWQLIPPMAAMDGRSTCWIAEFSVQPHGQQIAVSSPQEVNSMEIDPVCGMEVDPDEAAEQTEYQGRTYYFCCEQCLEKFQVDPNRYVQKMRA
jgi:YHS domain-containing protein